MSSVLGGDGGWCPGCRNRRTIRATGRLGNPRIAQQLCLSGGATAKHVAKIFTTLELPPRADNRRVRAILAYLTTVRE